MPGGPPSTTGRRPAVPFATAWIRRSSSDGTNWTVRASGTAQELSSVVFGNGRFVTVGATGTIIISTNGIDWSARASGTSHYWLEGTFANGPFVADGSSP